MEQQESQTNYYHSKIQGLHYISFNTFIYSHNQKPSIDKIKECDNIIQKITCRNSLPRWTFIILEYQYYNNPYMNIPKKEHGIMYNKMIECMKHINTNTSFLFNFQNNNTAIFIYFKDKKKLSFVNKDILSTTQLKENCTLYKNISDFCGINEIDLQYIKILNSESLNCTGSLSKSINFICTYLSNYDDSEKTILKVDNTNAQLPDIITSSIPAFHQTNITTLPDIISEPIMQIISNNITFTNRMS